MKRKGRRLYACKNLRCPRCRGKLFEKILDESWYVLCVAGCGFNYRRR